MTDRDADGIPAVMRCPVTLDWMVRPVRCIGCKRSMSGDEFTNWFDEHGTCPLCRSDAGCERNPEMDETIAAFRSMVERDVNFDQFAQTQLAQHASSVHERETLMAKLGPEYGTFVQSTGSGVHFFCWLILLRHSTQTFVLFQKLLASFSPKLLIMGFLAV